MVVPVHGCTGVAGHAAPSRSQLLQSLGPVRVGQEAPAFGAQLVSGEAVTLARLLNPEEGGEPRALAITFFASWCKPCVRGLVSLSDSRAQWSAAGMSVLAVGVGESRQAAGDFLRQRGVDLPVVGDRYCQVGGLYGLGEGHTTLPRTVVIGGDGKVRLIVGNEGEDFVARLMEAGRQGPVEP